MGYSRYTSKQGINFNPNQPAETASYFFLALLILSCGWSNHLKKRKPWSSRAPLGSNGVFFLPDSSYDRTAPQLTLDYFALI